MERMRRGTVTNLRLATLTDPLSLAITSNKSINRAAGGESKLFKEGITETLDNGNQKKSKSKPARRYTNISPSGTDFTLKFNRHRSKSKSSSDKDDGDNNQMDTSIDLIMETDEKSADLSD